MLNGLLETNAASKTRSSNTLGYQLTFAYWLSTMMIGEIKLQKPCICVLPMLLINKTSLEQEVPYSKTCGSWINATFEFNAYSCIFLAQELETLLSS